jgi:DNA-binding NarL/FixJ family response regulator
MFNLDIVQLSLKLRVLRGMSPLRIFVADDFEPWRRFVCARLQEQQRCDILEISDGQDAVQRAQELQPDLILLDIGLPILNGIEAARQIRKLAPRSKILFLSENRSSDIAEEALSTGAMGYVVKSDAGRELLAAVNAVLRGERFVSARLNCPIQAQVRESEAPQAEP